MTGDDGRSRTALSATHRPWLGGLQRSLPALKPGSVKSRLARRGIDWLPALARRGTHALTLVCGLLSTLGLSGCEVFETPPLPVSFLPQPPPPTSPPRPEPRTRGGVQAEIIRWFSAHGYRPSQVYALVDYVRMESNFNPCITNGRSYLYSFQWDTERARRLAAFAGTNSCPPLEKQLAFADRELRTNPNYSCFFYAADRTTALAALRRGFGYGRC